MIRRTIILCQTVTLLLTLFLAGISWSKDQPVKIGVLAKRGAERCLEKWSPTAEYLTVNIPGARSEKQLRRSDMDRNDVVEL